MDKPAAPAPPPASAPPAPAAVAEAPAPAATAPPTPAPFSLKKGTRIQLGYRTGKVDALRSAGKKPYEVRITWDGTKYPQMILYRTLELEHEKGALAIL